jgi:hypothetical protein
VAKNKFSNKLKSFEQHVQFQTARDSAGDTLRNNEHETSARIQLSGRKKSFMQLEHQKCMSVSQTQNATKLLHFIHAIQQFFMNSNMHIVKQKIILRNCAFKYCMTGK